MRWRPGYFCDKKSVMQRRRCLMEKKIVISRMDDREKEQLVEIMNSINFKGFENYHAGASLTVLLEHYNLKKYSYVELWSVPVYGDAYHVKNNGGQVMFLFTNSYKGRQDFEKWFLKIAGLIEKNIVVLPSEREKKDFSLGEKLQMSVWILQMSKIRLSMKEKLFCANLLLSGKRNLDKISDIIVKRRVRSIVTLADVHLNDYLVTAYCNGRGIKTVTLQHGFFPADDMFFRYSESDYFLTYSEYTKQLAETHKKRRGVFVAVGMPDYIGQSIITRDGKAQENFLVLLNGATDDGQRGNRKMLKICMEYAERNHCFFDVKVHPGKKSLKEYQKIVSKRGKFVASKSNVAELFEQYDFCVANVTTMALKAVYMLTPVLLLKEKNEKSFFGLDDSRLNFSNYAEMEQAVSYIKEDGIEKELVKIREFLCGSTDVSQNYQKFLEKL